jgi:hypothetical protein
MERTRTFMLLSCVLAVLFQVQPARALDLKSYADLLNRFTYSVEDTAMTRVDYRALQQSNDWQQLVASLGISRPDELATREEQLAFWINAYNILAIDLVQESYPVESIRDIGSLFRPVWKLSAGRVGSRSYSLGEIEHEILRPLGDPRIHAAIVCASTSCPALRPEPYEPDRLDAQLDEAVRTFLANEEKGLRIEPERNTVRLSRIFAWFAQDFATAGGVLGFVERYAPEAAMTWLVEHSDDVQVEYLGYDWSLNDLSRSGLLRTSP